MKRETIIAIVLGIVMGALIAIILILNVREKAIKEKKIITTEPTPTFIKEKEEVQALEVTSPKTGSFTDTSTVTIKGKAKKNSLIVLNSPTSEKSIRAENSEFSVVFPLSLGQNIIKITAYENGQVEEKTLQVLMIEK